MAWDRNPFRPTRWEHDSTGYPLIWFTPTAGQLSGEKSIYVHGNRGSGKTTLLRSVCWEDLLNNPSLKMQRRLADFSSIGIYIKLPDHVSSSMGKVDWLAVFPKSSEPDEEFYRFFSLALELVCADKALLAVHNLRIDGELSFQAGNETRLVDDVLDEFPLSAFVHGPCRTFLELAGVFRKVVRRMNEATGRGGVDELLKLLPAREPNELLSMVAGRLSSMISVSKSSLPKSLGFKFCLDDCEVLSRVQRLTVNTLVRKGRFPVSWVICSVGEVIEGGQTLIDAQPLTDADRRVISLDDRDRVEFFELCEAVASLRTYFALPASSRPAVSAESIARQFPLAMKLGRVTVNDIIHSMLRSSTSPQAKEIAHAAGRLAEVARDHQPPIIFQHGQGPVPPYYQTYLLWHWTGREDSFLPHAEPADLEKVPQRVGALTSSSFQAAMRRKMVGALLHLASRLGFRRLPLSGAGVVTSLADGSIRDFLEIMAEIFDEFAARRSSDEFQPDDVVLRFTGGSKIAARTQASGIYRASESFFRGVGDPTDPKSRAMARLVEALGKLTARLQSDVDDPRSLATTERGVFLLDDATTLWLDDAQSRYLADVIRLAEVSGYLRVVPVKRRSSIRSISPSALALAGFRLHRRFAPKFGFSYRGAYEPVRISEDYLTRLCDPNASITPDEWIAGLGAIPEISTSDQLVLGLEVNDQEF